MSTNFSSLDTISETWIDDENYHQQLLDNFKLNLNSTPWLYKHRQWVVQNSWGYGVDELHWMWKLVIDAIPNQGRILEIGVFKGQTLSLFDLCAKKLNKRLKVYGISPLDTSGDHYSQHPVSNYVNDIATIYNQHDLRDEWNNTVLLRGFSNNPNIISLASSLTYDCVFVDGCHDYEIVVSDLLNYKELVNPGGYIVVDDCNLWTKNPPGIWGGFDDVSRACQECLENDSRFKTVCVVAHDRIWQRISE